MKRYKAHRDKRPDELAYGHAKGVSVENKNRTEIRDNNNPEILDISFDFGDIQIPDIDIEGIIDIEDNEKMAVETRYIKPRRCRVKSEHVLYENAVELAKDLRLSEGMRADCLIAGNFIFGDFIEALVTGYNIKCTRMIITTLSLSENNIDSLHNLITHGYIDQLDMVISTYFYANEYHNLVPYMYRELDIDNKFQLSVADIHTKTCQIKTLGGKHIVMHGSANLRSSANIEQFCIEENKDLYEFYEESFDKIIEQFKTINKPLRGLGAWDIITRKKFN